MGNPFEVMVDVVCHISICAYLVDTPALDDIQQIMRIHVLDTGRLCFAFHRSILSQGILPVLRLRYDK